MAFDAVVNLLLFVPVGFGIWFHHFRAPLARVGLSRLSILAILFGAILQAMQLVLPSRTAALSDVEWNAVGVGVGLALAWMFWKIGEEVWATRGTVT